MPLRHGGGVNPYENQAIHSRLVNSPRHRASLAPLGAPTLRDRRRLLRPSGVVLLERLPERAHPFAGSLSLGELPHLHFGKIALDRLGDKGWLARSLGLLCAQAPRLVQVRADARLTLTINRVMTFLRRKVCGLTNGMTRAHVPS